MSRRWHEPPPAGERGKARQLRRELAVEIGNAIGKSVSWEAPAPAGAADPDEMDPGALAARIRGVHKA